MSVSFLIMRITLPPPRDYSRKSLLHVEDDALWGQTVQQMASTWQDVCHVGTATSAQAGIALCRTHQPDLALLGLTLPDADGFDLALTLANFPRPPRMIELISAAGFTGVGNTLLCLPNSGSTFLSQSSMPMM